MKDRVKLTGTFIEGLKPPEKRTEYYDDLVTGMILRITKTGHKSFAFRYWYDNQSKQITIGKHKDVSLAQARKKARDYKQILSEGKDPLLQRQAQRENKPVTLGEYVQQFKNDYVKRKLKASTQKTYSSRLNKILHSDLSRLPIKKVSRSEVRSFLRKEAKEYPTNANRLHSILSKVFNEAVEDGLLAENPIKAMGKIAGETRRDPRYTDEDIHSIWQAINEEWQPMQGLLKMLLLTGQRLGETSRMKWDDVYNDLWVIPISEQKTGSKTNKNHKVPLSNLALDVLEEVGQINGANEHVFASLQDNEKPLTYFKTVIDRIRDKTGLKDFRIHDLRHIVATGMIDLDVPFTTVGRVLNHKALAGENAVTARYINTDLSRQKRTAMNKWANHLQSIIRGQTETVIHKIG